MASQPVPSIGNAKTSPATKPRNSVDLVERDGKAERVVAAMQSDAISHAIKLNAAIGIGCCHRIDSPKNVSPSSKLKETSVPREHPLKNDAT